MAGQVGIEVALSKVKILPVDVQESLKKVQQYVADEDGPHSQVEPALVLDACLLEHQRRDHSDDPFKDGDHHRDAQHRPKEVDAHCFSMVELFLNHLKLAGQRQCEYKVNPLKEEGSHVDSSLLSLQVFLCCALAVYDCDFVSLLGGKGKDDPPAVDHCKKERQQDHKMDLVNHE